LDTGQRHTKANANYLNSFSLIFTGDGMTSYTYSGKVVSGSKEGAYWVSKYSDKIEKKLGFKPFPGTLNIDVGGPVTYPEKGVFIPSWKKSGKYFGAVFLFPATMLNTKVWVILPEIKRNPSSVIEVISDKRLRTWFGLKDGMKISIEMEEYE